MNSSTSHALTIVEASRRAGNVLLDSVMSSFGESPWQRLDPARPAVQSGPSAPRTERAAANSQSTIRRPQF
jgi:hypothetical protein